jgi:hypothetical protein
MSCMVCLRCSCGVVCCAVFTPLLLLYGCTRHAGCHRPCCPTPSRVLSQLQVALLLQQQAHGSAMAAPPTPQLLLHQAHLLAEAPQVPSLTLRLCHQHCRCHSRQQQQQQQQRLRPPPSLSSRAWRVWACRLMTRMTNHMCAWCAWRLHAALSWCPVAIWRSASPAASESSFNRQIDCVLCAVRQSLSTLW